ncbi:MAG: rhomboid family intramembrane serine protease [Myxococcales bacterium]|nr:rhomboid family intramembrane serine protease [Myxococcales bacterium]
MQITPPTAEFSALTQQLLLSQGAQYRSHIGEAHWKAVPVMLELDGSGQALPGTSALPAGKWLVLPWDAAEPHLLENWLAHLTSDSDQVPDHVVMITSLGHVNEGWLSALSIKFGLQISALQVAIHSVAGAEQLARPLDCLFEEETQDALRQINPLEHLTALADPRNHAVFLERLRRATPGAFVTRTLIGLNIGVYVVMLLLTGFDLFGGFTVDQLTEWGANVSSLTMTDGQWWRLLSCTFVHAGLLHLGMNMWALHALGEMAERLFGNRIFVVVYLLSGLGGSIASLGFTLTAHPMMPSIGASGAVFGIMGGLLGFMLSRRGSVPPALYRSLTRNAIFFIGLNLMIGLSIEAIDNAAHMGGLATGTIAGALLSRDLPPAPQPSLAARATGIGAVLLALGLGIVAL